MNYRSSYEAIVSYMPQNIKTALLSVEERYRTTVNEVRIRVNRPVALGFSGETKYLSYDGKIFDDPNSNRKNLITPTKTDIDKIVSALCRFSVHSCGRELSEAFFFIENGIRVGVGGSYSFGNNQVIKYVNALNFRISREIIGCADIIYSKIYKFNARSLLICGGVNSGKTTILRDLCRICGSKYKSVLIDERKELASTVNGVPTIDVGIQTDVIDGCKRSDGINSAIRTLSPHIIFCDEISTEEDADAIMNGFGCGVKFAATIHAKSFNDLKNRRIASELMRHGIFEYAVILEGEGMPGRIREIRRLQGNA